MWKPYEYNPLCFTTRSWALLALFLFQVNRLWETYYWFITSRCFPRLIFPLSSRWHIWAFFSMCILSMLMSFDVLWCLYCFLINIFNQLVQSPIHLLVNIMELIHQAIFFSLLGVHFILPKQSCIPFPYKPILPPTRANEATETYTKRKVWECGYGNVAKHQPMWACVACGFCVWLSISHVSHLSLCNKTYVNEVYEGWVLIKLFLGSRGKKSIVFFLWRIQSSESSWRIDSRWSPKN